MVHSHIALQLVPARLPRRCRGPSVIDLHLSHSRGNALLGLYGIGFSSSSSEFQPLVGCNVVLIDPSAAHVQSGEVKLRITLTLFGREPVPLGSEAVILWNSFSFGKQNP